MRQLLEGSLISVAMIVPAAAVTKSRPPHINSQPPFVRTRDVRTGRSRRRAFAVIPQAPGYLQRDHEAFFHPCWAISCNPLPIAFLWLR